MYYTKLSWTEAKKGDVVFLQGTKLGNMKPYGPHMVIDPNRRELQNATGKRFINYPEELIKLDTTLDNAVQNAAHEVSTGWDNAAADIAASFNPDDFDSDSEEMVTYTRTLDSCGGNTHTANYAMGDWFHDNVNSIIDHCGDRIYDEVTLLDNHFVFLDFKKEELMILIAQRCKFNNSSASWQNAMNKLIADWQERL